MFERIKYLKLYIVPHVLFPEECWNCLQAIQSAREAAANLSKIFDCINAATNKRSAC